MSMESVVSLMINIELEYFTYYIFLIIVLFLMIMRFVYEHFSKIKKDFCSED